MAFDLANDGQCLNIAAAGTGKIRPQIQNLLPLLLPHVGIFLIIHVKASFLVMVTEKKRNIHPCKLHNSVV